MNTRDVVIGAGMGAALAFMLDPQGGGRRRALVRDKMVWASRKTRGLSASIRPRSEGTNVRSGSCAMAHLNHSGAGGSAPP